LVEGIWDGIFLCSSAFPVRFLIGGDGPKRVDLEEMRERHWLHDRVQMLGALPHDKVKPARALLQFINIPICQKF
jgi:phosphatidylinositol glycan class A protein